MFSEESIDIDTEIKVLGRRDNVKSAFQLSVNDLKSTLSKACSLRKINICP